MNTFKEGDDLMDEVTFVELLSNYFNSNLGDEQAVVNNVLAALKEDYIVLVDEADEWDVFQNDINKMLVDIT